MAEKTVLFEVEGRIATITLNREVVEQSEDHAEGTRSFVEKRKPVWKAR